MIGSPIQSFTSSNSSSVSSPKAVIFLTVCILAWEIEGVVGARMTGAGFGGCTVSIVKDECVDNFKETIRVKYKEKIGYEPDFYVVSNSDGTGKIS